MTREVAGAGAGAKFPGSPFTLSSASEYTSLLKRHDRRRRWGCGGQSFFNTSISVTAVRKITTRRVYCTTGGENEPPRRYYRPNGSFPDPRRPNKGKGGPSMKK